MICLWVWKRPYSFSDKNTFTLHVGDVGRTLYNFISFWSRSFLYMAGSPICFKPFIFNAAATRSSLYSYITLPWSLQDFTFFVSAETVVFLALIFGGLSVTAWVSACSKLFPFSVASSQGRYDYSCSTYQEGQAVDGPCGQRCICVNERLRYCCRQRKDFPSMTREERIRYVNTVIKASTHSRYRRQYNRIIAMHARLFDSGIHSKQQFLPWHRW